MIHQQRNGFLRLSALCQNGMCQAIRGLVQLLIRQRSISHRDGDSVRKLSGNLLESPRDGRLDILFRKFNKLS